MANPFLVLGGIAVGIITASFGVLQVPGWVASAQDASAINDLRMISEAQAASASIKGEYAGEIATLQGGGLGLSFAVPDERVKHFAADGDGWCSVALSDSGRYFAVSDTQTAAVSAETLNAAIAGVCEATSPDHGEEEAEVPSASDPAVAPSAAIDLVAAPSDMAFSPDGRMAYVTNRYSTGFSVVDTATNTVTRIPTTQNTRVVDVSPDGSQLAIGADGSLQVFDIKTMALVKSMALENIEDVAWAEDGAHIVVTHSGNPGGIKLVDPTTMREVKYFAGTSSDLPRLAEVAPDKYLVYGNFSAYLAGQRSNPLTTKLSLGSLNSAASTGDGTAWVLWAGKLRHVNALTSEVLSERSFLAEDARYVEVSPDGKWIYVTGLKQLTVLDATTNEVAATTTLTGTPTWAKASPDGKKLYLGVPSQNRLSVFSSDQH